MASATQDLDPSKLASWEDAFKHPLPIVRKLEQQLRRNIDDNRHKLRGLVGHSYRDLVATADRITEMDRQIQRAETHLADLGHKCSVRAIDRITRNHAALSNRVRDVAPTSDKSPDPLRNEHATFRAVSTTRVLQCAIAASVRVVKRGEDALLAAKLLVLARLLYKSLAEGPSLPAGVTIVEDLRKKLVVVRKRLLAYIEESLGRMNTHEQIRDDEENKSPLVIKTLCAYSLLSSTSPKDTLRYFLKARLQQLEDRVSTGSEKALSEMLSLYGLTLLSTRELFPRRFADALTSLSNTVLSRDASVKAVAELNLDVYEDWIPEDVRNFTPWVRHDALSNADVTNAVRAWSGQAQDCVVRGLRQSLEDLGQGDKVLALRRVMLSKYISLGARHTHENHWTAMSQMRDLFSHKMKSLALDATGMPPLGLKSVEGAQSNGLGDAFKPTSVWELANSNLDLTRGATAFRQAVIRHQYGRTTGLEQVARALDEWIRRLREFNGIVATMRTTKWDDDMDFDLDDLDNGEELHEFLNNQDPQTLEDVLGQSVTNALQEIYSVIREADDAGVAPSFLLRVLRELGQRRRSLGDRVNSVETNKGAAELISFLYSKLARTISDPVLDLIPNACRGKGLRTSIPVSLWDGSPPLPIQPSPAAYRFLTVLHHRMTSVGSDLWTLQALHSLKHILMEAVTSGMTVRDDELLPPSPVGASQSGRDDETEDAFDGDEGTRNTNDRVETEISDSSHTTNTRVRLTQNLFDALYLHRILSSPTDQPDDPSPSSSSSLSPSLQATIHLLHNQLLQLSDLNSDPDADVVLDRLGKSANDYWRKTYLLFGLLAGSTQGAAS